MDVKDTSFKIHPKYPDIALSYDYENRLYENTPFSLVCKNGKDEWMTIYYFDRYTELDSILKIDFDKKGKPEIVLYYREFIQATGASTGKSGIIIINIDDTPKELCHVVSYAEENLSHYNQVGGKSEFNKCSRKVSVSSKGVQISRNSTKNKLSECTNVPEGLYVLTNEGFKKQK
ncbi:MAG: hypothetical protein J0M08_12690 [Bacteroidetes bacterium]|nr:hypothetical protein [Bacteroidota bacterium]